MTRRLTYGEECWLRETAAKHAQNQPAVVSGELVLLALAELDELRAERGAAEQRGRQLELADVLAWVRDRGGQHTNGRTSSAWNHCREWVAECLTNSAHRKP